MSLTAEEQQKVDDLRVAVTPHAVVRASFSDVDGVVWPPSQADLQLVVNVHSHAKLSAGAVCGAWVRVQADHFLSKGQP